MQKPQQGGWRKLLDSLNSARRLALITVVATMLSPAMGCARPTPTMLPPVPEPPVVVSPSANPLAGSDYIDKTFEWTYWRFDDIVWKVTLHIPTALYDDYRSRPRPSTIDYTVYAADDGDVAILTDLGVTLKAYAEQLGLSELETVHFIATFVQQLPYTLDLDTTGFDDYGRYPVETLVEDGGDCEDTAILLGKLMKTIGYDVVLVRFPDHMGLGVKAQEGYVGTYFTHEGVKYFYLETTGLGGRIGLVPEEYVGLPAYIYDFSPRAIVTHDWTGERSGNTYTMVVTVHNYGAAAVENCTVRAGFDAGNDSMWNAVESEPFALPPKGETTLTLKLEIPNYNHTRLLVFIAHDGTALDKSQSRWFDE